jgi:hypothetical protein
VELPRAAKGGASAADRRAAALEVARTDLLETVFDTVQMPKAYSRSDLPGTPEQILQELPKWEGANEVTGKAADVAHGVLVVGDRVYLIRSAGIEGARDTYAAGLAPKGVTRLGIGFNSENVGHVEGSAAAILRKLKSDGVDVSNAQLYVNLPPCIRGGKGCRPNLENMLPEGTNLEVWATDPSSTTLYHPTPFKGKPDR